MSRDFGHLLFFFAFFLYSHYLALAVELGLAVSSVWQRIGGAIRVGRSAEALRWCLLPSITLVIDLNCKGILFCWGERVRTANCVLDLPESERSEFEFRILKCSIEALHPLFFCFLYHKDYSEETTLSWTPLLRQAAGWIEHATAKNGSGACWLAERKNEGIVRALPELWLR